jgi:hypothetical protein
MACMYCNIELDLVIIMQPPNFSIYTPEALQHRFRRPGPSRHLLLHDTINHVLTTDFLTALRYSIWDEAVLSTVTSTDVTDVLHVIDIQRATLARPTMDRKHHTGSYIDWRPSSEPEMPVSWSSLRGHRSCSMTVVKHVKIMPGTVSIRGSNVYGNEQCGQR